MKIFSNGFFCPKCVYFRVKMKTSLRWNHCFYSCQIVQRRLNMLGKKGWQHTLRQVNERGVKTLSMGLSRSHTHTQTHTVWLSICLSDWRCKSSAHTYMHILVSAFLYSLFCFFCFSSLPHALFASVRKQINLPSTCWTWAWHCERHFWVWWMSWGRGGLLEDARWKSGIGNTMAPCQLRSWYRTGMLITSTLREWGR